MLPVLPVPVPQKSQDPRTKNQDPFQKNESKINQKGLFKLPVPTMTSICPQVPDTKTHFQDPRTRPKTQDGMVKLLPIPSLKKVRITKTKTQQKIAPRPQDSPRNLLKFQDMMLQDAHGPVPIATFATFVTFVPLTRKGDYPLALY